MSKPVVQNFMIFVSEISKWTAKVYIMIFDKISHLKKICILQGMIPKSHLIILYDPIIMVGSM